METEFIYWRHHTLPGIKVEEICGGENRPMSLWREMAYQVYSENGREVYREIGHFRNGAPFLIGENGRISITHTGRFLAVATLPPTPEVDLSEFTERAAMGIDAERADREQVLKVREKFLSAAELEMIPASDVLANVMAWTAKEALYKAAMSEGLDFAKDIAIRSLPKLGPAVPVYDKSEGGSFISCCIPTNRKETSSHLRIHHVARSSVLESGTLKSECRDSRLSLHKA